MSRLKKFIFPLLIICAAAAISWWSSHQEASIRNHVQFEITKLVPRFHADHSLASRVAIDPVLEMSLANSLEFIYKNSLQSNTGFVVIVTNGDDEQYGDGLATHVATIQINEQRVAGYRIICHSENAPLQIAGVLPGNIAQ